MSNELEKGASVVKKGASIVGKTIKWILIVIGILILLGIAYLVFTCVAVTKVAVDIAGGSQVVKDAITEGIKESTGTKNEEKLSNAAETYAQYSGSDRAALAASLDLMGYSALKAQVLGESTPKVVKSQYPLQKDNMAYGLFSLKLLGLQAGKSLKASFNYRITSVELNNCTIGVEHTDFTSDSNNSESKPLSAYYFGDLSVFGANGPAVGQTFLAYVTYHVSTIKVGIALPIIVIDGIDHLQNSTEVRPNQESSTTTVAAAPSRNDPPAITLLQYVRSYRDWNETTITVYGWSKEGKIAFTQEWDTPSDGEHMPSKTTKAVIFDFVEDTVEWSKEIYTYSEGLQYNTTELTNFMENFKAVFGKYAIEYQQPEYKTLPISNKGTSYTVTVTTVPASGGNGIKSYSVVAETGGKKKTLQADNQATGEIITPCGYFISPFEERALIVVAELSRAYQDNMATGEKTFTGAYQTNFRFIGCNLRSGFR